MPATEPERPWTKEQLNSDDVGKKVIAKFIQVRRRGHQFLAALP